MAAVSEKINDWIRQHKLFAIMAPAVFLLVVFFITQSMTSFNTVKNQSIGNDGYNNTLPGHKKELQVQEPNEIYKKTVQDSLDALNEKGMFNNLVESQKENDSLEQVLRELENFSLGNNTHAPQKVAGQEEFKEKSPKDPVSLVKEKLAYRKLLQEGKDEIVGSDGTVPLGKVNKANGKKPRTLTVKASVYRDQFILPNDNVELILSEDVVFNGSAFEKNTFIYAQASLQGNRVLLDINNIDHEPMDIIVKDSRDGREGIYSKRAGELWREFMADAQDRTFSEAANEVSGNSNGMIRDIMREIGTFFRNKRLREKDKILLVNDHKILLEIR